MIKVNTDFFLFNVEIPPNFKNTVLKTPESSFLKFRTDPLKVLNYKNTVSESINFS